MLKKFILENKATHPGLVKTLEEIVSKLTRVAFNYLRSIELKPVGKSANIKLIFLKGKHRINVVIANTEITCTSRNDVFDSTKVFPVQNYSKLVKFLNATFQ
jgi:hypothetical protein